MIVAIIPAAGLSRRMGRPKLVLEVGGHPLISRVVGALLAGGADRVLLVAPPLSQQGAKPLASLAAQAGAEVVILPAATEDMRATLQYGLAHLDRGEAIDGILIAPGDSLGMTAAVVREVLVEFRANPARIVVPICNQVRGHPLALSWQNFRAIRELPPDVGLNALLKLRADDLTFVEVGDSSFAQDMNTPEDYLRANPG